MVTLTRIYTKGGDRGQTSLGDGTRVNKQALRVATYGTVDEANAAIGIARLHTGHVGGTAEHAMLGRIQNDLFDVGADLCRPGEDFTDSSRLRVTESQVERIEREIDAMNTELRALQSFILPGGTPAAAHLHLARTIVRRAERLVCELSEAEPVNPAALRYLNRLSDHLFVLARRLNNGGAGDVLWVPGATR
jgi:cob(I)alamin adenosyltransferase